MKEFLGTKGEWKINPLRNGATTEIIENGFIIASTGWNLKNPEEVLANAKLIVASKDLLEALQDSLRTIEYMDSLIGEIKDHQTYFNTTRNSMEQAKDAISKALD